MGRATLGSLFGLLAALLVAAGSASAIHWCGDTAFAVSPGEAVSGRQTAFKVTVTNNGVDTTQLDTVRMTFSWEGTPHSMAGATILAGQKAEFTASATPPSPGSYQLEIWMNGTSSGDILRETSMCNSTATISAVQSPLPGFEAGTLLVGAFVAAAVWGRRRP